MGFGRPSFVQYLDSDLMMKSACEIKTVCSELNYGTTICVFCIMY